MTKLEFLNQLRAGLSALSFADAEERIVFYSEMIDDRMEDGMSEEKAVAAIGSVDDVLAQIISGIPLAKLAKEKLQNRRRLKTWEITLLAFGSPIWLALLISLLAVACSLYVVMWSVVISIWAIFGALLASALVMIVAGALFIYRGYIQSGIATIGAAHVSAGLSVFFFFGSKAWTKLCVNLTKKIILGIKRRLIKKEVAQ